MEGGVLVGLGTDALAEIWPMLPGWGMHSELETWVEKGGISAMKAIQAATSSNAKILKMDNRRGSVMEGLDADLILVDGNPAKSIEHTQKIKYVFLQGRELDRENLTLP